MEKFSYEANGYNRSEINQFITDVIKQTEGIIEKCRIQTDDVNRLKEEVKRLNEQLSYYTNQEDTLKAAILKAEETGVNIRKLALDEKNLIITEAKNNANRIVNEALLRADKIQSRADTLESNMKIFKRKLKIVMEQQAAVIEEIEILELN